MPTPSVPFRGLDALGGYFPLHRNASGPGWRTGAELLADLDDAVADYQERLGTDRLDIAGSLLVQGWAARLTAVHVGSVALTGAAPDLAAEVVDLRLPAGGALQVHLRSDVMLDPARAWGRLTDDHLEPLVDAVHASCRSGRRRLRGNIASVRAGALMALHRRGLTAWQPGSGEPDRLGRWVRPGVYARATCCGLVRVPGRPACGDCVLRFRTGVVASEELP